MAVKKLYDQSESTLTLTPILHSLALPAVDSRVGLVVCAVIVGVRVHAGKGSRGAKTAMACRRRQLPRHTMVLMPVSTFVDCFGSLIRSLRRFCVLFVVVLLLVQALQERERAAWPVRPEVSSTNGTSAEAGRPMRVMICEYDGVFARSMSVAPANSVVSLLCCRADRLEGETTETFS